jgi:hypothetical protein
MHPFFRDLLSNLQIPPHGATNTLAGAFLKDERARRSIDFIKGSFRLPLVCFMEKNEEKKHFFAEIFGL